MRVIFVVFFIYMQVVSIQTRYCEANLLFGSLQAAKSARWGRKSMDRGHMQSVGIQAKTIQTYFGESKKNHLEFVRDKASFPRIDSCLSYGLIWDQCEVDQPNKYCSDNTDKLKQLKSFLIFSWAAFLLVLSFNSPKKLQKTSFYVFPIFYLSMNGVIAQPSTMTPVCSNCPACLVSVPNTCLYCSFGYYYSGICYRYTNMPGCTSANGKNCTSCNPSYFLGASSICISCSSAILNCQSCTSSSVCSQCISGYTFNSSSSTCDICSSTLPNCTTCSSKFICTGCIDQTFFLNSTSKCELCSSKKPGCHRCTLISCIQCNSGYYLQSFACQYCNTTLQGCVICLSSTVCTSCLNTAYTLIGNACIPCGSIFPFCLNCTSTVCVVCDSNFFLNASSQCQCKRGSLIDNECIDIAGCSAAIKFKNRSYCTQCNQSIFKFNTSTLKCDCKIGFLLNYQCSVLYGCITMVMVNNKQTCLMCNKNKHFIVNNAQCSCDRGYYLEKSDNTCYQTCGDGILLYLQCDDGNLINGDGCTSKCTIEDNFVCSGGNQTTPTHCLNQIQNLKPKLEKVQNVGEYNIAKFQFRIVNFDEFLYILNYTQLFHLEINKKHKVNSISLTNNKVTFIVEYFEDLEGFSAIFHLNLDPQHFRYPKTISLPFEMISQTAPLVLSEYPNETVLNILSAVLFALSILGFILLLVAPCYHKMIALETLIVLQLCNLTPFLIKGDSLVIRVFKNLSLSNGFGWSLLSDSTTFQIFGQIFDHMSLPKTFTENMFLNECFLIAIVIAFIIVFFIKDSINDKNTNIKRQIRHYVDVYFWNLIFSTTMSLFLFFLIALNCNNLRVYERKFNGKLYESTKNYTVANTYLNSISILIVLGLIAVVGFTNIFTFSTESKLLNQSDSKILQIICRQIKRLNVKNSVYVAIFLVNFFVSFGLLSCLFFIDFQYKVFAYLFLSIPYAIFVLVYRPYIGITDNLSICLGQITSIIFLIGLCIKQYFRIIKTPLNLRYEFYFCIGSVCLLTIFVASSIVRLAFEWYNDRFNKKPTVQRKRKKNDPRKPSYQKVDIQFDLQESKSQCFKLLSFQEVIKADNPDLLRLKEKMRNNLQEKRSMIRNNAKNISDAFDPIREILFKNNDDLK